MRTKYIHRELIAVSDADRSAANTLAAGLPDATEADRITFGSPCSADGSEPATHYVCCGAVTERQRAELETIETIGAVPSTRYWRFDTASGKLAATNVPESAGRTGKETGYQECLADAGLAIIGHAIKTY